MGSITSRREKCDICGIVAVIAFEVYSCPRSGGKATKSGRPERVPERIKLCAECLDEDVEIEQESRRRRYQ